MMAKLSDLRRRFPPDDAGAYAAAYAEAGLAASLGELVRALRCAAGLGVAELAASMGVDEDAVVRAEEGDASLTVAFVDRVARAVGLRVEMTVRAGSTATATATGAAGTPVVVLGAPGSPAPPRPQG
jgi:ribosome-binding protein aMBF1 (putative translation factor)